MVLAGKLAIVTGGAGALGSAVVARLIDAGAHVFVPSQRAADAESLAAGLGEQASALQTAQIDLTDEPAVLQGYAQLAAEHGGIDLLVNIAGGFGGGDPVAQTPWSLWAQQLDLNLKTCVLSCRAALPHMLGRQGAIVNIGTRTATQSGANLAAYAAAKRGVIALTEALAAELRHKDITANVILPGVIDTPANRRGDPDADFSRWVKPEQIAEVILFLLGPHARIISGASIPVYGRS